MSKKTDRERAADLRSHASKARLEALVAEEHVRKCLREAEELDEAADILEGGMPRFFGMMTSGSEAHRGAF